MKKKNLIIIIIASVFMLIFVQPSAWAESPRQYRWDGAAIGVGAVMAGSVLLNNCLYARPPARVSYWYVRPSHHRYYPPLRHLRYWEIQNRRARNRGCKAWHHGHYHHYRRWVP